MSQYGCWNKPRPVIGKPIIVQNGWMQFADGVRLPETTTTPYVMSEPCQYTQQHASDPRCSGCVHKNKEEA